tara:strand:- start:561 stop:719 length:159 start_codon:yes stop_codon:yes gene_type:complete
MTQLWEISWGPPSDQLYPVVLEETYPHRSTNMTLTEETSQTYDDTDTPIEGD